MRSILIVFVFLFLTVHTFGQTDSLVLFTKQGCSNCKNTKAILKKNSIDYIEYQLEQAGNPPKMFGVLNATSYKGPILLPVIILNNKLFHPAIWIKDTLEHVTLSKIVDSLIVLKKLGKLHLAKQLNIHEEVSSHTVHTNSDCEVSVPSFYLVVRNLKSEQEAGVLVTQLRKSGFPNAGYINHQKYYRVYTSDYSDLKLANTKLLETRQKNKAAYVLSVKN